MVPEEKKEFKKREPATNVKIADLSTDYPRVAILGTVVRKDDSILSIVLDDGSGEVNVIMKNDERYNELDAGQVVRVIGKLWGEKEEIEVQAEIVQDFSGIDIEFYKKVFLK